MMRSFVLNRVKAQCTQRLTAATSSSASLLILSSSSPSSTASLFFFTNDVMSRRSGCNGASQGGINTGNLVWGNNSFIDPSHYANLRTNNNINTNSNNNISQSTNLKKVDTQTEDNVNDSELEHLGNYTFDSRPFLDDDLDSKPTNIDNNNSSRSSSSNTSSRHLHHTNASPANNKSSSYCATENDNAQANVNTNNSNNNNDNKHNSNCRDILYRESNNLYKHGGFGGIPMKPQGSTFTDASSNISARRNPLHSSPTAHSHQNVLQESTMRMSSTGSTDHNNNDHTSSPHGSCSKTSSLSEDSEESQHKLKNCSNCNNNNNNINNKDKEKESLTADVRTFDTPHRLNDHVFHKTSHSDEVNTNNVNDEVKNSINNCKSNNNNNNNNNGSSNTTGFGAVPYTQEGNTFRPTNEDATHTHSHHNTVVSNQTNNNNNKNKNNNKKKDGQHLHESKMDLTGSFTISSHNASVKESSKAAATSSHDKHQSSMRKGVSEEVQKKDQDLNSQSGLGYHNANTEKLSSSSSSPSSTTTRAVNASEKGEEHHKQQHSHNVINSNTNASQEFQNNTLKTKSDSGNLYNNNHTYTDANGNKLKNASHNYNPTTPSHQDGHHHNKDNKDKK